MFGYNKIRIFAEQDATDYLDKIIGKVRDTIESESDDYLLNVNEGIYLDHIVDRFSVDQLEIHNSDLYVSTYEMDIPAERFPRDFYVRNGKSYKKDIIKYHIPFSGNTELLRCKPNPSVMWSMPVTIENNEITFEIINFRNNPEEIKREAEKNKTNIMVIYGYLDKQISSFNRSIREEARKIFRARKDRLLKKSDLLSSLGVPIKRKNGVPETFSVSTKKAKPRITVKKPEVHEKGYKPEPTLDDKIYQDILRIIHDFGKQLERQPSTYSGKCEEHLRDHILLMLEPNFEGSATGETFNKTGKTDILLRHENSNVFVAECKFWSGKKAYLASIDQLLGYLTWRDSKAAVVLFVSNKDFSHILKTVKEITPRHENYLRPYGEYDETWLQYGFHLKGDPNREIKLAVMMFHIPQ